MKRSILPVAQVMLLALLGCASELSLQQEGQRVPHAEQAAGDESAAIYEAVFRYQFKHNASGLQQAAGVYCLRLGEKDPPVEFLRRFDGHAPPVKASSACSGGMAGSRDTSTGARGLVFRVEALRREGVDKAEVDGGYYEAGLSSSGNTYFLERKEGVWVVVRDEMHWISERRIPPNPAMQPAGVARG